MLVYPQRGPGANPISIPKGMNVVTTASTINIPSEVHLRRMAVHDLWVPWLEVWMVVHVYIQTMTYYFTVM